jgi:hypothetical protein
VEDGFVPPVRRGPDVALAGPLGDFPIEVEVEVEVCVAGCVDDVGGDVPVVLSVVVGFGDDVVVVTGGPGLFARTELGENGGFTFGLLAPKVHASTLPGGGS